MKTWRKGSALLLVGMMIMSGLVALSAPVIADENLTGTAGIQAIWNNDWMINDPAIPDANEQIVLNYDFNTPSLYYLGDNEADLQITFRNGATAMDIDTTVTFTLSVGTGNTLITVGETSTFTLNPPAAGQSPWIASAIANALFTIDIGNSGIVETTYPMRIGVQYTQAGATETNNLNFEVYVSSRLHYAGTNLARDTAHELTMDSGDYIKDNSGGDFAFEAGDKFKEAFFDLNNNGPDAITDPQIVLTAPTGFTLVRNYAKFVGTIAAGADEDLIWRVDVAPRTAPGIYQGTALLTYMRTVSGEEKAISETARPIDYTVDFSFADDDPYTPGTDTLWSEFQCYATNVVIVEDESRQIDYAAPYDIPTIEQDTYTDRKITVEVTIVNNGNSDLYNLELEIVPGTATTGWDFFRNPKFFWTDTAGISYDTITGTFDLAVGAEATFSIEMIVLRNIPIGEHRLPILYRGYYFDDGSLGGSTGFMETNGGGDLEIIFSLSVTDGNLDCIVTGIATGNAGDKTNIVAETITVTIQNREQYNFIHVTIRANFTGTPWYMPVIGMRSPHVWANNANEIAPYATWAAGASIAATFTVDTDPNMTPDRYPFLIEITAVIQETLEVVTTTIDYRYGVVIDYTGYGPRIQISAFTADNIVPGEEFRMTLTIENVGDDTLRDVFVVIATDDTEEYDWDLEQEFKEQFDWSEVFSNWMDVTGPIEIPDGMFYTLEDLDVDNVREIVEINLYMDGVYSKPGARISLIRIVDLAPRDSFNVTYDMFADKDMVNGKPYTIEVRVTGTNSAGVTTTTPFDISVMSSLPGKSYNPTELNWFDAGLKALALFLFFIIVLAILMFVYNMFKGEPYDDEDEDFDFEDDEPFEADEPMPVEDAPEAPQQELVEP